MNQQGQEQQQQPQIQLQKIGGSNNSHIYKMWRIENGQKQELYQVLKMIMHSQQKGGNIDHCKECQHLMNEYKILSSLDHPNILKIIQIHQQNQFCSLQQEQADCDIFQLIKSSNLDIGSIRKLFYGLLQGIVHLHSLNIAHNDIKLPNMFIFQDRNNKDFNAKLADFGFASQFIPNNQQQFSHWSTRSQQYFAPEIFKFLSDNNNNNNNNNKNNNNNSFCEFKSDMFAFGLTLFETVFRTHAYNGNKGNCANENDIFFSHLYNNDPMAFWEKIIDSKHQLVNSYQQQENSKLDILMDLITKLFNVDPIQRISAEEALNHPWFK